ncbi:hypothetical protein KSS87_010053 [Heliosperma pusillum]|nr:hypothetical protein KSS87_010053 [Heliosperma pusillum]
MAAAAATPFVTNVIPLPLSLNPNPKPSLFRVRCRFIAPGDARRSTNSRGWKRAGTVTHLESTVVRVPTSVPVRVAHELLQAGHHYLDVRTPEEYNAGHVYGAVNVPYLIKVGSGMAKNSNFREQVFAQFDKDDEILIGCQSGKRSLMAANDLLSAGYTGIMDIAGGFDAWIQSQLPAEL